MYQHNLAIIPGWYNQSEGIDMTLQGLIVAEPPPVALDASGTARVGGTRVTLDTVVGAWQDGATAEEIVSSYDTLPLADVYAVISYHLRHGEEVEDYLSRREEHAQEIRSKIEAALPASEFRARLLARQQAKGQL